MIDPKQPDDHCDSDARKRRAREIRSLIESASGKGGEADSIEGPVSPREFVERRTRELDRDGGADDDAGASDSDSRKE